MEPADLYCGSRSRLLELVQGLDDAALRQLLAATPPWTVTDGYRHLAGVCGDFLDGRLEGLGTDAWTAAQLASRADRSIAEIAAEWDGRGPDIDARMREAGGRMAFMAFDAWTHEQDIRAAVGQAGLRDHEAVPALAALALRTLAPRYASSGAPAATIVVDGEHHTLGEGDAEVVLRTTPYELLRIVFGRRSQAQVEAAGWEGPAAPVIDALHIFDFPTRDIAD